MDIYQRIEGLNAPKIDIGKSVLGRSIYALKAGDGNPVGLIQYAIHGREFSTARLAIEQYKVGVARGSCYFIPLVNPDGALLAERGLSSVADGEKRKELLLWNGGNNDFRLWKANANGVDLNVNFPAKWGKGASNTRTAGAENYIGKKPFSEPETVALKNFTLQVRPDYTVSYHTKGEEIYWHFYQSSHTCPRDKRLAEVLSRATGYPLAEAKGSAGGYKDWCIQRLKIPSFTIEVGSGTNPLPLSQFDKIYKENLGILVTAALGLPS